MADLAIATSLTTIERALQTEILVGLGKCVTVADNTALKALASASMKHGKLAFSTGAGFRFRFDRYSTTADNGTTVLAPTDAPAAGRWLRTTSTSSAGYLVACDLYEGEAGAAEILERFKQQRPCVVINWQGSDETPKSLVAGALYDYRPRFALWAVSGNMRGEQQASLGSQIAAESTRDPGANRIIGDLRELLAGNTLGGQAGVKFVEIGRESRVVSVNSATHHDRLMVYQLDVEVRATVHLPDTDLVMLQDEGYITAQYKFNNNIPAGFDEDNYVTSGMTVPLGAGLTKTIASGVMKFGGASLTVPAAAKTFTASKVTYRDVNSTGVYSYVEVDVGEEPADVAAGKVRIGATVTDGTGVVWDRLLVSTDINMLGGADIIT